MATTNLRSICNHRFFAVERKLYQAGIAHRHVNELISVTEALLQQHRAGNINEHALQAISRRIDALERAITNHQKAA